MPEYTLSNSAAVIDAAISSVASADNVPTASSQNMVTSGGVKNYVDNVVGPFINKSLTTESVGIAATDNDTSIPTCAAVNDALAGIGKIATYGKSSGSISTFGSPSNQTVSLPITETSDPHSLGTVNNGVVTLGAGTYLVSYFGEYAEDDNDTSDYWNVQLRHNGSTKLTAMVNETDDKNGNQRFVTVSGTTAVVSGSSQTVGIYLQEASNAGISYRNVVLTIVKLA